jgi:hypothetical protein
MLRLCLVHRSDKLDREDGALLAAIGRRFEVHAVDVAAGLPQRAEELAGLGDCDACVWMVRFRDLPAHPPFDWQGWGGLRVMFDWDAMHNYWSWSHDRWRGAWPTEIRRHRFDLLVCTNTPTAARFEADGVPAAVVFKAFDAEAIHPLGGARRGLGTFGYRYPPRRAAEHALARHGLAPERFQAPFAELNEHLNRYEAALVCNMVGLSRRGGDLLDRLHPGWGVRGLGLGPELMLKTFEVAGSGAVLLTDDAPDLADLGFRHGETALVYRDLDELVEVWRTWHDDHEALAAVGAAGARLAHERHTWDHRAAELESVLVRALAGA